MNMHTIPPADSADVRAAVERIIASPGFRSSPQLVALLGFIVDATLRGKADYIKAYTVGTDALGRDPNFDPQRDPIVRVEAGRLRRALAVYYGGDGIDDQVVIEIPRGRYVPTFRRRDGVSATNPVPTADAAASRVRWTIGWRTIVAALAVLAVAIAVMLPWFLPSGASRGTSPLVGAPVVMIEPLTLASPAGAALADVLNRALIDGMSRIQAIPVVSTPQDARDNKPQSAGQFEQSRVYRLGGIIDAQPDGTATVALRLVSDGVIVWTRDWQIGRGDGVNAEVISRGVSAEVGGLFGVLHARVRAQADQLSPGYRCVLAAADYMRGFDLVQHERVRACLEKTIADDPQFTLALGLLAFVYEREYLHALPPRVGDLPPLERSMTLTQSALALNQDSVIGQLALMDNLYMRGDLAGAYAAGDKAMQLNPNEVTVAAMFGTRLFFGGETERGAAMLKTVSQRFSRNPIWLDFSQFCVAYLEGDLAVAARYAKRNPDTGFPYILVAQALIAAADGNRDGARARLAHLRSLYPGWLEPKPMLERFIRSPAIVERLTRDLDAIEQR
jgi:hypothetical protein